MQESECFPGIGRLAAALVFSVLLSAAAFAQGALEKQQVLWQKLGSTISDIDRGLDGVMGVAILDLADGHKYLLHENEVFAQASSIKICVLAELYRQAQQGKLKLTDLYTVNASDLVQASNAALLCQIVCEA